jgi:quercetin dioxygenase-like cupin family protein
MVRVVSVPEHEQGGDPACWAHLTEDDSGATPERAMVVDLAVADGVGGAVWSLPHGGDLDANLVRLAPGGAIGSHVNNDVDVLIVVREGEGELTVDGVGHVLTVSTVAVVQKGAERSITAGPPGLAYLSIHRRRSPLTIRPAPPVE